MRGILLIDKPKGITSFDVIRELRKKVGVKKIGHAGTLDPLATGLLIIGVGSGTKKLEEYLKLPKRYEVEILVGQSRTTGDMEGAVVADVDVESLDKTSIKKILRGMEGELELPVPKYSAIKLDGEPLYKRARRGEKFEPPIRKMMVDKVKLLKIIKESGQYIVTARMDVGSGVYVRSIVEEFGKRLGFPTVAKELRRTRIGKFKIWRAKQLDSI